MSKASQGDFGDRLLKFRKKRNLTHEEFASRVDAHPTTISLLENKKRNPSLEMVQKIEAAFDLEPGAFVKPGEIVLEGMCFTIMPFGGWFDRYYEEVYEPAIVESGLEARRADDVYRSGNVVDDIWDLTKRADLILADLTGKNPNVLYELGLAHAIGKRAILVVDDIADVPFDLRALRVIEYDKNAPDWSQKLRTDIRAAIEETLKSPVDRVLSAFIKVDESADPPSLPEIEKEILELRQAVENLRGRDAVSESRVAVRDAGVFTRRAIAKGMSKADVIAELIGLGVVYSDAISLYHAAMSSIRDEGDSRE